MLLGLIVIFILAGIAAYWFVIRKSDAPSETSEQRRSEQAADTSHLRIIATGDQLPHETINLLARTGDGYDYTQFFEPVQFMFDSADVSFCNQEALSSGEEFGVSGYPAINAPTEFARDLHAVGCNVIGLANNHINDKNQAAINKTLEVWDGLQPLAVAGANRSAEEQSAVRYFEVKGVKFAFVAYTDHSNRPSPATYSLNMMEEAFVASQMQEARAQADIVLVSAHWGTEYSPAINTAQTKWAEIFAANGADIVIGHGPHVIGPVQKLPKAGGGETVVWYSLGNMIATQLDVESQVGGFAVMDFGLSGDSPQLTSIGFMPTYTHYEWTADEKAREDLLKRTNLKIYPLDQATDPLARSQFGTTVDAQMSRITGVLSQFIEVPILSSR